MPEVYLLIGTFYVFISIFMAIKYDEWHQCHSMKAITSEEFTIRKNRFLIHEKEVEQEIIMLEKIREKLRRISLDHSQSMS